MSAVTNAAVAIEEPRAVAVASWKAPIIFGIFTVLFALLPLLAPRDGETTFRLASADAFFAIPDVILPANGTAWVAVVILAAVTAFAFVRASARRSIPLWLVIVYVAALLLGFLAWAAAGETLRMISLLGGALALATPLIFGALGGVIGERAGVVNIAIEAQLLAGAFSAAIASSITGSPWAGLVAAMGAGMLVSVVLGAFAIKYFVDQVIVGVVLNVLVTGLTSFLFSPVLAPNAATLNSPPRFERPALPLRSEERR